MCWGLVLSVQQLLVTLTEWVCITCLEKEANVWMYTHTNVCAGRGHRTKDVLHTRAAGRENGMKTVCLPQPSSFCGAEYPEHFT